MPTEKDHAPAFDLAELTQQLTADAERLVALGVPVALVGEAFVATGLKFELAAHGPGAVAMRLVAATSAMTNIMTALAEQPHGSNTKH